MADQAKVLLRMRDVAFALAAAENFGQKLNRINLQKFIYLLDIVAYVYKIFPPKTSYLTYKNGPYDAAIQNAIDSLIFRGLAQARDVRKNPDNTVNALYSLNETGRKWANELAQSEEFKVRYDAALEVARKVNEIGWGKLVSLVYAEPTFANQRPKGFGRKLDITNNFDNSASYIIELIEKSLKIGSSKANVPREYVVELFFRFLQKQMERQSQRKRTLDI